MLTMATPTFSDAYGCFDGWYSGLSLGGTFRSGHGSSDTVAITSLDGGPPAADVFRSSRQFDAQKNSALGAISGGYGYTWCDKYYGALEGFLSLSQYNQTNLIETNTNALFTGGGGDLASISFNNTIETKLRSLEFGLDLRPGYLLFPDTLLFARIGVAYNKLFFNANILESHVNISDNSGGFSVALTNKTKKCAALRLGLGLERQLYNGWSIRADYIYTYYGRMRTTSNTRTTGVVLGNAFTANASDTKKFTLSSNSAMLGLFYYW